MKKRTMRTLSEDDAKFLEQLRKDILNGDRFYQREPAFWGIMDKHEFGNSDPEGSDCEYVIEDDCVMTELEEIENEHPDLSDEDKQKIYEEMLAKKEAEEQARIAEKTKKAEEEKIEGQAPAKKKYIKCVCGKCGEVFYIGLDKAVIIEM